MRLQSPGSTRRRSAVDAMRLCRNQSGDDHGSDIQKGDLDAYCQSPMRVYYFYPYNSSNNRIGLRSDHSLEGSGKDLRNIAQEIAEN